MANFKAELPTDLIDVFSELEDNIEIVFGKMTMAGAKVVHKNILSNMKKSFKSTRSLEKGLKITKIYKTPSDDGINTKISFYGYDEETKSEKYPNGVPIPLKALAREFGTTSGESKRPFFRKSFRKQEIEQEMLKIQEEYIKGDNK